ncbi:chlorite dismutase family protein [Gloeobacter morelensis]|uniref:hydrogen peroxide-dependent heme synthase n=1 Tax=Gloeobacter morelensis MG652769 TaxID=2781736 RepID=A0ABY3PMK8_9CYAN|nr:chlorite dismutase family protein [Gloeobacter morelensis]UFP94925.1 chlorite dismutase family protein [Gloeobacter morelensis MG652769]
MDNRYSFLGGKRGPWRVARLDGLRGEGLEAVERLQIVQGEWAESASEAAWVLRGLTSNVRYATRPEVDALRERQPALARPEARYAALIPIKKSARWWELAQDERRAIFEETSHHTAIGMEFLPAVARRLHHCRDIGEPFDFLTWFEYAPEHTRAFEDLLDRLRVTREWDFVEREVDIRLVRIDEGT